MKRLLLLALLSFVLLSACAPACDVEGYTATVDPIIQRWDDAVAVANQTPRMTLAASISDMQAVQRDAEAVEVPACLTAAHDNLLSAMEFTVGGFLSFLSGESESEPGILLDKAEFYMEQYGAELAKLNE